MSFETGRLSGGREGFRLRASKGLPHLDLELTSIDAHPC